jgi:hypothetical protein
MARKPTDPVQLKLRFNEKLRKRIERAAAHNDRSMNDEIIRRLEDSFRDGDILTTVKQTIQATLSPTGAGYTSGSGHVPEPKK